MYNIAATVAGALLAGGAVLYGGYVYVEGRQEDEGVRVAEESSEPAMRVASDRLGRGGAPEGTEPLSFGEGAPGERLARGEVPPTDMDTTSLREAAAERGAAGSSIETEEERLAALGTTRDAEAPTGLRGFGEQGRVAATGSQLRGDGPAPAPIGAPEGVGASTNGSVEDGSASADADALETRSAPATAAPLVRNARLAAKPDGSPFFTRNQRLTDKPDTAGYFTQNAPGEQYAPCLKADGTRYAGPGTATNPFAAEDPCLPRGTAQSYELARLDVPTATASDAGQALGASFGVPLGTAFRGVSLVPPAGGNFGSDYRGG